jgi:hypothetical protein
MGQAAAQLHLQHQQRCLCCFQPACRRRSARPQLDQAAQRGGSRQLLCCLRVEDRHFLLLLQLFLPQLTLLMVEQLPPLLDGQCY